MGYKCEIHDQNPQPTLSIRTHTSVDRLGQVLGETYASIMQHLVELGEQPSGAPFTAYFNMDMQNLDVEIGFPVDRKIPGKETIQSSEMPGGKYASCLHKGPYSEITHAYEAINKFLQENSLQPTGVVYEFYLNKPDEVSQEELLTQIEFPLKA